MNFIAEPRTIDFVFSYKKKMVIPRFQREFVWDKEKLTILWNDILESIELKDNKLITTEYFLGSLVLIDADTMPTRQIIDGQQRLTVLTIFFSALYDTFLQLKQNELANIIYGYVITKDNNGQPITLLETESPKPFFQLRIQAKEKDTEQVPNSKEEERLLEAYNFFMEMLSSESLTKIFKNIEYLEILKSIRDQVLKCKLVYVTVTTIDDAYMIFEVLNGKGEPLTSLDLIKNCIFSMLTTTNPVDDAKVQWDKIKKNIENEEDLTKFYRHFWLSRYHFIREKKLYNDFTKTIKRNKSSYKLFLKDLCNSSINYKKIIVPKKEDWNTTEKSSIFYNLQAFSIFNVTQVRTIVLALLDLYSRRMIKIKLIKDCLNFLENFHFVFSAICSARPSGLESRYSKYAILLFNEKDKSKIGKIINDFITDMKTSIPSYDLFLEGFKKLYFTDEVDKDKKKIQYVFSKIERAKLLTNELDIAYISLEHITPQSSKLKEVGFIGNLLPLSSDLNSECDSKPLNQKMEIYKKSNFKLVQEFCEQNKDKTEWSIKNINDRTENLAHYLYYELCCFG